MTKNFEYSVQVTHEADITIEDMGNCIIEGNTIDGIYYYLWIQTSNTGVTHVCKWGPVIRDAVCQKYIKKYNFNYTKINYSDSKVEKAIESFLNDPNINIYQARELTIDELKEKNVFVDTNIYLSWEEDDE